MKQRVRVVTEVEFLIDFDGRSLSADEAVERMNAEQMHADSYYWSAGNYGIHCGPVLQKTYSAARANPQVSDA